MTCVSKPYQGVALAMAVVVLAACSSSISNAGSSSGDPADGGSVSMGDCKAGKNAAWATPSGTPFTLPTGVTLAGEITGDVEPNCGPKSFVEYGGDYLPVCIGLKNTTTAEITVTLPAGLTFIPKDPMAQNGIILQSHDLTVAAGETAYFSFRL